MKNSTQLHKFSFQTKPLCYYFLAIMMCFVSIFKTQFVQAQAPAKMSYQAVIRNSSNVLLTNTTVGIQVSIIQGSISGPVVHVETGAYTTNANGLVSMAIGTGTVDWSAGPYYIKIETDPLGGTNYTISSITQLLSVPYAMYANKANIPDGVSNGDMLYWNGTAWVILPIDAVGKVLKIDPSGIPTWVAPVTTAAPPVVTTDNTSGVLAQSANVQGTAVNGNGELIISRGVCYSTSSTPTVANSIVQSGAGLGVYNVNLTGLTANTLYYVRAFATSIAGTSYGAQLSFTTQNGIATLTTTAASSINPCDALAGGNISTDGGSSVSATGVVYNTSPNPTTSNSIAYSGGYPSFSAYLSSLSGNTLYYYRAYCTNAVGTYYGNELSFTTASGTATLSTSAATSIGACDATVAYLVTNNGGSALTNSGWVYATTTNPTLSNSVQNYNPNYPYYQNIDGSFPGYGSQPPLSGLSPNTLYYVRSFATNCAGTTYGPQISFTTTSGVATLTTSAATAIGGCGADIAYAVTNNGGGVLTNSGLVYSTSPTPTLSNSVVNYNPNYPYYQNINGSTISISGLSNSTTYYVRSFATNCAGTTYGPQISFSTLNGIISLTTGTYGLIDPCYVQNYTGTTINSNNGGPISVQGICYNTSSNPTIANNTVSDNYYYSNFSTTPNTTYYMRAYATNCSGVTFYGNEITFTTPAGISSLTTGAATAVTAGTATFNGTVNISPGVTYYSYFEMGFCYSTSATPTLADSVRVATYNYYSTPISFNAKGLTANTTYYYRTYSKGFTGSTGAGCVSVSYGPVQSFTTAASPFAVGQAYGGGIIVWVNGTSTGGLIAAMTDQGTAEWGCESTTVGATGILNGTGQSNTTSIVTNCGTSGTAAKICDNLVLNSFSDWYLPSEDELILIGNLNYFPTANYWSSTETSSTQAKYVNGVTTNNNNKSFNNFRVRAVRSF